jgi:hypothetical protein
MARRMGRRNPTLRKKSSSLMRVEPWTTVAYDEYMIMTVQMMEERSDAVLTTDSNTQ